MNGRTARKLRKKVYGAEISSRFRKYARIDIGKGGGTTLFSDSRRRHYQQLKKNASRGPR